MPAIAAATATVAAPATPACSRSGAKARPVAGRQSTSRNRRHTEQRAPGEGGGDAAPTTFCSTATAVANRKKRSTSGSTEPQQLEARAKTNRGEERILEWRLERRVESDQLQAATVRDGHGYCDDEPADDRRRHVQARASTGIARRRP